MAHRRYILLNPNYFSYCQQLKLGDKDYHIYHNTYTTMVTLYKHQDTTYFYLIEDIAICTVPDGDIVLLTEPHYREDYVNLMTWKETGSIIKRALETVTDPYKKELLLRYVHVYHKPLGIKDLPPLERLSSITFPVYRYECHTWSDGEEHDPADHNSAYDFDYIWIQKEEPFRYIFALPHGILMKKTEPLDDHKIVRHATWDEVQPLLDKEIYCIKRTQCNYSKKMLMMFGMKI